MYVIIDNYDSFTYNLYQYLCEITDKPVKVFRNDRVTLEEIEALNPGGIIISPGPGTPEDAGISVEVVKHFAGQVPILGVCLGHQSIAYAYGARIISAARIVHGKAEEMQLDGKGLFRNIPNKAVFTRYHSLALDKETIPADFEITATAADGEIMGIRHKILPVEGVQFHPESIASQYGKVMLKNFLTYKREPFNTKELLNKLIEGKDLEFDQAAGFMDELTEGNLNIAQTAGFLVALNIKGYTPDEIAGFASVLRKKKRVLATDKPVIDTCGTGGDGMHTFNISSLAAIVVSTCGAYVAKHGNRAMSSQCGSADFYAELGIPIDLEPEQARNMLEQTGFCFMFAQLYHKAMKHAAPVRRELGIKTIMNLIGPLSNPANVQRQLIGIYDEELCLAEARAAHRLGAKHIMVVHGLDGLDEISVTGLTRIVEIDKAGEEKNYIFNPVDHDLDLYPLDLLKGGTAQDNVKMALNILDGKGEEAIKQSVLLNAGAALVVAGLADDIMDGYAKGEKALTGGRVKQKLEQIKELGLSLKKTAGV
jgi:anthranilate synthase/phosphoribosyltransferase